MRLSAISDAQSSDCCITRFTRLDPAITTSLLCKQRIFPVFFKGVGRRFKRKHAVLLLKFYLQKAQMLKGGAFEWSTPIETIKWGWSQSDMEFYSAQYFIFRQAIDENLAGWRGYDVIINRERHHLAATVWPFVQIFENITDLCATRRTWIWIRVFIETHYRRMRMLLTYTSPITVNFISAKKWKKHYREQEIIATDEELKNALAADPAQSVFSYLNVSLFIRNNN